MVDQIKLHIDLEVWRNGLVYLDSQRDIRLWKSSICS